MIILLLNKNLKKKKFNSLRHDDTLFVHFIFVTKCFFVPVFKQRAVHWI